MAEITMRSLFGDQAVGKVSDVFDEIGLVIEALNAQADLLTNEDHWLDQGAGAIVGQGTQMAITVHRLRQLQVLGFHLAVKRRGKRKDCAIRENGTVPHQSKIHLV